ncbi:hypothetical protein HOA92_05835 [archaeon]|jgi:hypothetical protein|nr:hypothetical protein [archaeon]MBT6762532.1 hypothetical protein [archaeon]
MLQKTKCTVEQARSEAEDQPILITVLTEAEIKSAIQTLESRTSLKGIQLPSSLIQKIPKKTNCNFLSIELQDPQHTENILKYLTPKNQFIELIIPQEIFNESLIKNLKGVKRVIIDFSNQKTNKQTKKQTNQDQINNIFAILISNKFFPFTKGLTQDQTEPRHMVEFYSGKMRASDITDQNAAMFQETKEKGDLL